MSFIPPMECKPISDLNMIPRSRAWQYELKLDGYRCIAHRHGDQVHLYSRNGKRCEQFPGLVAALRAQPNRSFTLDGEIVALDEEGRPCFNALQRAGRVGVDVRFYAFDLLRVGEKSTLKYSLKRRQKDLRSILKPDPPIHLVSPLEGDLAVIMWKLQEFGYEGLVAKEPNSIYVPGQAPGTWLKKKMQMTDEFIIGGYIPTVHGVGELIVGKLSDQKLMFVGSVDDGFVPRTRKIVLKAIEELKTRKCPFENLKEQEKKNGKSRQKMDAEKLRKAVWIKPKKVVELAMNEWTPDKHLRHARFLRLRPDKEPAEVNPYPE